MITDDPGTPGPGKWENNVAIMFEHRSGETAYDLPAIDLNYGVGEHIQLTLQTAPVLLKRSGQGLTGGLGGTEAAGERRILDRANRRLRMDMFSPGSFQIAPASVPPELAREGHRLSNS